MPCPSGKGRSGAFEDHPLPLGAPSKVLLLPGLFADTDRVQSDLSDTEFPKAEYSNVGIVSVRHSTKIFHFSDDSDDTKIFHFRITATSTTPFCW